VLQGFCRRRLEHIIDVFPTVFDGQDAILIPLTLTRFALDPNIWKKMHLDALFPDTVACHATPVARVETKTPRLYESIIG
jgi:hypothetical protein